MLSSAPLPVERAPLAWAGPCAAKEVRFHQLAPYIGKLKSSIAGNLVEEYTSVGDTVLDPFCGSGTIPLECVLRERNVLAFDSNPYAVLLTRAKLDAPATLETAVARLEARLGASRLRRRPSLREVPSWVRRFFHPSTLRAALQFADECIEKKDAYLLACLLGILHHQRPGFLSYPSSHLVPYLRERKFPRAFFPELYRARSLEPRLRSKLQRTFRNFTRPQRIGSGVVRRRKIANLEVLNEVDAIITSPPYMNALDYVRDNRLRMWFLDRSTTDYSPESTDKRTEFSALTKAFIENAIGRLRVGGRCVLVVGETVQRKRMTSHPAEYMLEQMHQLAPRMVLERVIEDAIPDVRRTRRDGASTKKELVLVLRKSRSPAGGFSRFLRVQ